MLYLLILVAAALVVIGVALLWWDGREKRSRHRK